MSAKLVAGLSHNFAEITPNGILHRKGAAPSDRGLVPVPGSRASLSYLVEPLAAGRPEALASIAHGAGRKYDRVLDARHGCAPRNRTWRQLTRNPFGGLVLCEDRDLLVEEAGEAYKTRQVIADLAGFGLARVVASFRPLITFKTARGPAPAMGSKPWREDRR